MKTTCCRFILSGLVSLLVVTFAGPAFAACTMPGGAPDAQAGDLAYNVDDSVMQYCNGVGWIALGSSGTATMPTCGNNELLQYDDVNDEWDCAASSALTDNLGNHIATANIQLGSHWLSGDGDGEGITVDASGNVGVGVSPSHKLHVAGNLGASASAYINFGATDGSGGYGFRDNAGVIECKNSGGSWAPCIDATADCTNDTSSVCKLQATRSDGDAQFLADNIKDGVNILGVTGTYTGSCTVTSGTTWTVSSSTCTVPTTLSIADGGTDTATDSTVPTTGSATYSCSGGVATVTGTPTCSTSSCAGASVGGYCWYYSGVANQSCDTICATHGGCDLTGTRDYAGSGGSNANCQAVMDALGVPGSSVVTASDDSLGCYEDGGRRRDTTATTCAAIQSAARRACACNN